MLRVPPLTVFVLLAVAGFASLAAGQVTEETVFAAPSAGDRPARFERVSAERSGVDFDNRFDHPRRWLELWRQYFNGSIGTGVALGDVNGDGFSDLFVVGKDSPNALYLNLGEFRFEEATERAGVAGGQGFGAGAAFVDIDNDGHLDLYVCYVGAPNELFINDGSGRFTEAAAEWGLDIEGGSNAPSFADYDRDGDLDLYLQQNYLYGSEHLDGMPDRLLRNEGGRFVEVTEAAGIEGEGQGHVALWWDFNDDGWPDLYVTNDFERVDKLYRNNRDGTFTDVLRETLVAAPYSAMGADAADLNNNGRLELLAAEMLARDRAYYQQAVGPLSGKLISAKRYGVNQYMQNLLSVSVGPQTYVELSRYAGLEATDWTWAVRFADLDNDGWQDAYFTNGMTRAFHDGDLALQMNRARSLATRVLVYEKSPPLRERNLAFRNAGDFRFVETSAAWGLDTEGVTFAAAFADLDNDGDLDLVTSNWKGNVSLYRNHSAGSSSVSFHLEGVESNSYGVGSRVQVRTGGVTQTRELSLMRGYMGVDAPTLHFGLGGADRVDEVRIEWPSGAVQVEGPLEAGRRYRIRERERAGEFEKVEAGPWFRRSPMSVPPESLSREELYQARLGQFLLPFEEDRLGPPLAVTDLDGDGWLDAVVGGPTGQPLRVLENVGGTGFRLHESRDLSRDDYAEDAALLPLDLGGDGRLDLLVASGGVELDAGDEYYVDRLYWGSGEMGFERAEEFVGSLPPEATADMAALQLEGGERILLTAGGTAPRAYPFSHENAVYRLQAQGLVPVEADWADAFARSGRTRALAVADLNGDGLQELVQAREYGPPLLWRQEAGGLVRADWIEGVEALRGMWRSIAVADFNGDGRADIALGNLGLNNKYAVSPETPAVLFASRDPELAGKYIEAETVGERLYPRDSRLFYQVDFPDIAGRTGSYRDFARMEVEEAFTPEVIARYERFSFNERRSVILFQDEDGRFEATPLPDLAQVGTAIDLLAADFDGDGHVDLFLASESLSPQPPAAISPEKSFVALLRNDGAGGFETLWPWDTGLVFEAGQPRQLAWADVDGDGSPELLVSTNEGPLYVFERAESE